jgi:isopentenyl diphosphate isomerase/L-lactate dehydrogenase-like FMN-dependent dehydrogenase
MLEIMHTELDKTMALCGRSTLAEVDGSILLS